MDEANASRRRAPSIAALAFMPGANSSAEFCELLQSHWLQRPSGSFLMREGEQAGSVYILTAGWMILSKSLTDGHRQIVDLNCPGDLVDPASGDLRTSTFELETLTDVAFAKIPRHEWRRFCRAHPDVAHTFDGKMAAKMARISERMLRLGHADATATIAFVLCELCLRSGIVGLVENRQFRIPMSQQYLADLCGLSSGHVCRKIKALERDAIISINGRMHVVIHDLVALTRIAGIDADALRRDILPAH